MFQGGDLVRIAKDLRPDGMGHFMAGCEAIVIGNYADQYGGDDRDSYTLYLKGEGKCSWYLGSQLTLIKHKCWAKLKQWKDQLEAEWQQRGDLDWIFANGKEVLKRPCGASIQALAGCFGMTDPWGSRGDGITYYKNAMVTIRMAAPYLKTGDKAGWLKRAGTLK